jgi:predicted alpha/beta-hydrolase family hydrolase
LSTSTEPTPIVYAAHPQGQAPGQSPACLILAHGAGAGQQSAFIVEFARALAASGLDVVTFDFPYIVARRRIPDRGPVLEACYRAVIDMARRDVASANRGLFIGGKSMGGRISSHIAAQRVVGIRGLVFFGYPLHPPGRPEQRRDAHLPDVREPMLFIQGTRDPFGTAEDITALLPTLSAGSAVYEVADGDHSFKVRVSIGGKSQDSVFAEIFDTAAAFIQRSS